MNQQDTELAVNRLNLSYAHCIDDDRLEEWPDHFVDACFYTVTTRENFDLQLPGGLIYCDSQGMLRDRVSALREANIYERQRYRHILSMPRILAHGPRIRSETAFVVYRILRQGSSEVFATGCYHDQLELVASGQLKIARRDVVCDSSVFDTLLAIPL
jgi:3-phenylpropionate/cinnamic acid dioxygenase small subunit